MPRSQTFPWKHTMNETEMFLRELGSLLVLVTLLLCSVSAVEIRHGGGQNSSGYPPLPLLFVEGTHYQVGHQIGLASAEKILTVMKNNTFFNSKMLPYNSTAEGAGWYSSYLTSAQTTYPQYVDELHGIADGAKIPFSKLFLWNVMTEWELLLREEGLGIHPTPSCTDLYLVNGENMALIGHNEDNDPINLYTSFMVHARITDIDPKTKKILTDEFLAFCYAGSLCGKAFGINFTKGTITTVNAVFPKDIVTTYLGRVFLNRATLSMDLEDIVDTLESVPCSSGFSLNVGSLGNGGGGGEGMSVSNREVAPTGVTVKQITGYGYHFNMYMHSTDPQYDDPSSEHRLARVKSLPQPDSAADMLKILGDTGDSEYPIFRTATPPDTTATIATALFDLSKGVMYVYRGNPGEVEPQLVVPFPLPT